MTNYLKWRVRKRKALAACMGFPTACLDRLIRQINLSLIVANL